VGQAAGAGAQGPWPHPRARDRPRSWLAPVGSDIPHAIKRGDQIAYHTSPDVPDQFGWVVRLHPEADDHKRYLADLFIVPVVEGSSAATVTNVTYGPGLGQFSELPKDEDDIGRGDEGNTIHKPWQGG